MKTYRGRNVVTLRLSNSFSNHLIPIVKYYDSELMREKELDSCLYSKSPRGKFAWGYYGILPLNLSESILTDFFNPTNDEEFGRVPVWMIRKFTEDQVVKFGKEWELTENELAEYWKEVFEEMGEEI